MKAALKLIVVVSALAVLILPEAWARPLFCLVTFIALAGMEIHRQEQESPPT